MKEENGRPSPGEGPEAPVGAACWKDVTNVHRYVPGRYLAEQDKCACFPCGARRMLTVESIG